MITSLICSYNYVEALSLPRFIEEAKSVESFVDSVGVVTHLGFEGTSYDQYDDVIKPRLQELGIKHIRSDMHKASYQKPIDRAKDLSNLGIRLNLLTHANSITPTESLEVIKAQIEAVETVEGSNEWNIQPHLKYKGHSFPQGVINFQKEIYSIIKNDPQTANLEVIAPSLAYAKLIPEDIEKLGNIPCDINNMHSYPAGKIPSSQPLDSIQIAENKKVCGEDKPIIATETGYNNALNFTGYKSAVSEVAAGKYINRLFLEYFNRGVKRTYTYELIDLQINPEQNIKKHNWGLLRTDGSRKREYFALKHLLAILDETDTGDNNVFNSNTFDFSLKGDLTDVHHTLLQKKDGTLYLILWQEISSYDRENQIDIENPKRGMILITNSPVAQVNIYDPYYSPKSFKTWNHPQKIHFNVLDRPFVLEITQDQRFSD